MGTNNSLVVYTTLFEHLLTDIAECYPNSTPRRDWVTIQSRLEREGFSFLTKTLPLLGKHFDKCLQGNTQFSPVGFKTDGRTQLPKFLGWLFTLIFQSDGYLRSDASVQAIGHVRQLVFQLYKLNLPYEHSTSLGVIEQFIAVEAEIKNLRICGTDAIIRNARKIVTSILSRCCPRDIIPRHGPGSVSTGESVLEKSIFSRIYGTAEGVYPFTEYFQYSVSQTIDQYDRLQTREVLEAGIAKVILVPKDSRGPRLISCEPLELQWLQQGQLRNLVDSIESHWLSKGQVSFRDQSINRGLALQGSKDGSIVTLDMKDASDRVSVELVRNLFASTPWYEALMATRSTSTRLPDGRIVQLAKFAPMGSAVCFPVEALCFYALSVATLVVCKRYDLAKAGKSVFVYGDDIICNREDYPVIMHHLERFGLKFNLSKCCTEGFFRESCGCDAFKGVDITPVRLRTVWNRLNRQDATQLASYVSFSNEMHARGYSRAASYIQGLVEGLYGPLPFLDYREQRVGKTQIAYTPPGQVIGWFRPEVNSIPANRIRRCKMRFCRKLHYQAVRGYSVRPVLAECDEQGWDAMLRRFTGGSTELPIGVYAVAHRSRLTRTWGRVSP